MADEQPDEADSISDAELDKLIAEIYGIDNDQAVAASKELAEITPEASKSADDIAKIAQEKDAKKRDELLEQLKKKDPALFEGEVPELPDWTGEDDVAIVDEPSETSAGEAAPPADAAPAPSDEVPAQPAPSDAAPAQPAPSDEAPAAEGEEHAETAAPAQPAAGGQPAAAPAQPAAGGQPAAAPPRPTSGPTPAAPPRPASPPAPPRIPSASRAMAEASRSSGASQPQRSSAPAQKQLTRKQQEAIALVVGDVLGLVCGLFGLRASNKRLAAAVMAKTSRGWLYGLRGIGREFTNARNAKQKGEMAKIAVRVVMGMCNVMSVKAVGQLIFGTMTKADWIKAGATFLAQLAIWFGTAGLALTAQLALFIYGAAELIKDSVNLAVLMEK